MKIDLTCPVELWQYAMPTEDDAECTFVMNNLSDKVVVSVQVTLACFDKEDQLLFRQTERIQGLKAGVGERFSIMLLPSQWRDVEGVDVVIEKVWFDDASVWRKGNAPLAFYTPNVLPAGRGLDELRFVAGKDAAGYPQVQDQVWLCVCGRANALESDRCCRCERRREAVFASFSPENVAHVTAAHEQKLAQAARKAREENNALQQKREIERASTRRRRRIAAWIATGVAAAAAIAAVMLVWVLPTARYQAARGLLENGSYAEAKAAFSSMGEYRDAQARVLECDYQAAAAHLDAGDEESLAQAEAAFAALGDYGDSAQLQKQAAYRLGEMYLEGGSYELAAEKFQALQDYEDGADKLREATYRQADALLQGGNFAVARALFATVSDYRDAADKLSACAYGQGKLLFEQGDYSGAEKELSALGDYENALDLVKQANYHMAESALAQDDRETAGRLYLLAGDYGDAQAKANECIYQLAQEKKAAGDYEKAIELFRSIPNYLDSEGQVEQCLYEEAAGLAGRADYAGALAILGEPVEGQSEEQTLLWQQCNYRLGVEAQEGERLSEAEGYLAAAGSFEDSVRRLRIVRYALAESDLEAGRYADAAARYEALGTYRDSAAKLKQCRYALAGEALEQGDYTAAVSGYEALGSYKDSKSLLEEAIYQQALSLKSAGDVQGAATVLGTIPNSKRAADELASIVMAEAAELEAKGSYAEAAERYETLSGNEEAAGRAKTCRYALALQMKEGGDLLGAGAAFQALGTYQDAKAQSEECYEAYFGAVAQTARDLMEQKDYAGVVAALEPFSMEELSGAYADVPEMYNEACYQYAEQLYRDGKPYEALPYYQRVGDYRDTAGKKLERRAYLILGEWVSTTGKTAVFSTDGICDLLGEKLYYRVSNFSLYTGLSEAEMTITHKLSAIDKTYMSLRDIRNGQDVVYKFDRVGEWKLPEAETAPEDDTPAQLAPAETAAPEGAPAQTQVPEATPAPEGAALPDLPVETEGADAAE